MSTTQPILLSGIQPTGQLTLGNYLGAITHWVRAQQTHRCYFPLVDLHAITVTQDPEAFRARCYDFIALFIACGLDPDQHAIFIQSHVPAHAQLAWVMNCQTYMGELKRMTQFKDKSRKHAKNINVGLFDYPVLQAADILLYQANTVPVGADQKQHLELARDLAARFNERYGVVFTLPEPAIPQTGGRVMSLQDPTKKMSKSDENAHNYIALLDAPELVTKKVKRAVTDSDTEVRYDVAAKPGVSNLLTLYALMTRRPVAELEAAYAGRGYGAFKGDLAEATVAFLAPIQARYATLREDLPQLDRYLKHGADQARTQAEATLKRVYDAIGFIRPA